MKVKVLFLIAVTTAAILTACDNTFDFLQQKNIPPEITLIGRWSQETSITDSLKTSLKTGSYGYLVKARIFDAEHNSGRLTARIINNGSGVFMQDGSQQESFYYNESGYAEFSYIPDHTDFGKVSIEVIINDNLGSTATASLDLFVFDNLSPIAEEFKLNPAGGKLLEYDLDATASFDPDQNFGGGIARLEWNINGTIVTDANGDGDKVTRFTFPDKGTYEVRLVVIDNDGERSAEVHQSITL